MIGFSVLVNLMVKSNSVVLITDMVIYVHMYYDFLKRCI